MNRLTGALLASILVALTSPCTHAEQTESRESSAKPAWELVVGPFALHWNNEEAHKHVVLLGLERNEQNGVLWGASVFRNSFAQPSAYAYYGYRWDGLLGRPALYAKLSGGIIYGYKGQYADKVPFNHNGFGLAIIPTIGYRLNSKDALQIGIIGTAALIFMYSRRF